MISIILKIKSSLKKTVGRLLLAPGGGVCCILIWNFTILAGPTSHSANGEQPSPVVAVRFT